MFRHRVKLPFDADLFTTLISGSQSGIATTAAIIAGLVTGTNDRQLVLVSAFVAIVVQAFNAAVIHVNIAHVDDEIEDAPDKDQLTGPLGQATLQFIVHILASFIVLLPIIFVTNLQRALVFSMGNAIVMLFVIGLWVGWVVKNKPIRDGLETAFLGILVICAGLGAGLILN